ncbi:radical SAM protein [Candidatus Pacearchaeota archaeon]|nr:radical SAM protein [Candidatus Pacearchaeota archaeon]
MPYYEKRIKKEKKRPYKNKKKRNSKRSLRLVSKKIQRVSFEVTGKCNLKCFYCCRGYLNSPQKISRELKSEKIIQVIKEARAEGCNSFLFTGGEAFVKEDLDTILKECNGCFVEIYSNGTLITNKNNLSLIKDYVSRLTVTLDGTASHNFYRVGSDYRKIINNLIVLRKKAPEVKIKINTLINGKSVRELPKLYNLLKRIGIDEWHIDFPQLRGRLAEKKEKFSADYNLIALKLKQVLKKYFLDKKPFFLKIYKVFNSKINSKNVFTPSLTENPCAYKTDYSLFINAEGKYILCPSIPCQDITLASVDNADFNSVVKIKNSLNFKKLSFSDLKECLKCRYFPLCLGGCRGEAKIISNSFIKPDINACSLMNIAEKIIYPSLPRNVANLYFSKMNKNLPGPKKILKNLDEVKGVLQRKYISS